MNPETGLPELPEDDLFWRVKLNSVEIWRNLPDTDWRQQDYDYGSLDLSGSDWFQEERETEYRKVTRTWTEKTGWWIWETETEHEREEKFRFVRKVNRKQLVIRVETDKTGEIETIPGRWVSGDYLYYPHYRAPGYMTPDKTYEIREPVTKENLFGLCEKALKRYEDSRLVGDYPPKKFEGGVQ